MRGYWDAFRELLIIILGLAVVNGCRSLLEDGSGHIRAKFIFDFQIACNVVIFMIVLYRYGFWNVIEAGKLSKIAPVTRKDQYYQLIMFFAMTSTSFWIILMSYYVGYDAIINKINFMMYICFAFLCIGECLADIAAIILRVDLNERKPWLLNKLVWLFIFGAVWTITEGPFTTNTSAQPIFYGLMSVFTVASSLYALYVGRAAYFPFLFDANPIPSEVPELIR